jgi:hypothetical protein
MELNLIALFTLYNNLLFLRRAIHFVLIYGLRLQNIKNKELKMGRSITPKYIAKITYKNGDFSIINWKGIATKKTILKHLNKYNESVLKPDGANHHLFKERGENGIGIALEVRTNTCYGGEVVNRVEVSYEQAIQAVADTFRNATYGWN